MSIAPRGSDHVRRPPIRFGIRWDGGRRPRHGRLFPAVVLLLLVLGAGTAQARPMPLAAAPAPAPVGVVVVAAPARVAAAERLTERLGGAVHRRLGIVGGFTASVPHRALGRLHASKAVRVLSLDARMRVSSTTDAGAEAATASSGLLRTATGAAALDPAGVDGSGVDVAVLDSGVMALGGLAQPGKLVHGPDFSVQGRRRRLAGLDTFGHGTHVAGVIAGRDPVTGFEGVAPGARIVSLKVAGADGATSLGQVLLAMDWLRRHRRAASLDVRVLNVSLGVDDPAGYRRSPLAWAVEQLWRDGIAVVAAAGNNGGTLRRLDLPAADPFVIAVGATDTGGTGDPADDRVADYTSRSDARPPDVVAPGSAIVSYRVPGSTLDEEFPAARVGEGFFRGTGTSQATAVVSGLAARLLSQRPGLSPDQLKALLRAGAVDLAEGVSADGAGRVDVERSAAAATPTPADARQVFAPAVLDGRSLLRGHRDRDRDDDEAEDEDGVDEFEAGNAEWAGRRWSGRRWSGMKWLGTKWAGMSWSGRRWSALEWVSGAGV